MTAKLIITVDTEEEGLWGGRFRAVGNTVQNVRGATRFQELCEQYGYRPTYLVDYPVVEDDEASNLLESFHAAGRCEIGAHLHPWCSPPLDEQPTTARESYLCNLPPEVQEAKIERLTEAVEARFGRRPTSFRAGRYGLDIVGARILADLDYVVDSSVIPFTDYRPQHGPNFSEAPFLPYRIGCDSLCQPDSAGQLLEVPVSLGYSRPNFYRAHRWRQMAAHPPWRQLRAVGILDRMNVARRIKLSPEQADARQMNSLIDAYLANGAPCLIMMLHSSSLVAGGSPYAPDAVGLQRLYDRLETTLTYCRDQKRLDDATLASFATHDAVIACPN